MGDRNVAELPESGPQDLSGEIVSTIDRRADERVTCKRISGNSYRCNWWAPESLTRQDNPSMHGLLVTTHRVRHSRFLNVTKTAEGLVIEDWSNAAR
jgi:hypothetical protein